MIKVGSRVKVTIPRPNGERTWTGRLVSSWPTNLVTLEIDGGREVAIPFDRILHVEEVA